MNSTETMSSGLKGLLLATVLLATFATAKVVSAAPFHWCPPMSSDACQMLDYDYEMEVGGQTYCCIIVE